VSGRNEGLCVLAPIADGHEQALRDRLRALPTGLGSPLAGVPGTHFARWAIVALEDKDGQPLAEPPRQLLFSAEFDGELEPYVAALCVELGAEARAIWSHCAGCPVESDRGLAKYLLEHRVPPGYSVVAYPDATVEDVRASLALRDLMTEFVMKAAALDPPALKRTWLDSFRGVGR
jgi:hypothetical protein